MWAVGRWVCWRRGRHVGGGRGGNVVVGGERGEGAESHKTRRSPSQRRPRGGRGIYNMLHVLYTHTSIHYLVYNIWYVEQIIASFILYDVNHNLLFLNRKAPFRSRMGGWV